MPRLETEVFDRGVQLLQALQNSERIYRDSQVIPRVEDYSSNYLFKV